MSSESVRKRLEAATDVRGPSIHGHYSLSQYPPTCPACNERERREMAKLALKRYAPTDLAAALKVIEATKSRHYRQTYMVGPPSCRCSEPDCPTLEALDEFEALP